jgi:hypothetical protein
MTADPKVILSKAPPKPLAMQESLSPKADTSAAVFSGNSSEEKEPPSNFQLWLHRINILVFVFLCAVMGVLLIIVPWWPQWTDNYLVLGRPEWRSVLANGFTRGVCSGLGVLDVWIGFWEAIHYHEEKPA